MHNDVKSLQHFCIFIHKPVDGTVYSAHQKVFIHRCHRKAARGLQINTFLNVTDKLVNFTLSKRRLLNTVLSNVGHQLLDTLQGIKDIIHFKGMKPPQTDTAGKSFKIINTAQNLIKQPGMR